MKITAANVSYVIQQLLEYSKCQLCCWYTANVCYGMSTQKLLVYSFGIQQLLWYTTNVSYGIEQLLVDSKCQLWYTAAVVIQQMSTIYIWYTAQLTAL